MNESSEKPPKNPAFSLKNQTTSIAISSGFEKQISMGTQDYRLVFGSLPSHEQGLLFSWLYQKSPRTRRYYQRIWGEFLGLFENSIQSLRDIEIGHLVVFLKTKESLKPASRNLAKNSLSSFLSFLTKSGFLEKNPGLSLSSIPVPDRVGTKVLSLEQLQRMYECEESPRNRVLMKLLYFSGMRVSELCGLRLKDLIKKSNSDTKIQILGKGGVARVILVPSEVIREIFEYRKSLGLNSNPESPLFISGKGEGKPLNPSQIYRVIKMAAVRAKVRPIPSPHWFRHTSATHALENGAPIHVVQKTLGHKSVSTTGRYLEANPKESNANWLEWE
ncbi:MAG: tyrosine-type recombinase/integrase [Bdellovibrionales bacterium]|nr:tyrosine-type recombinase/integrase [Bdellovibrionales bacterium]